LDELENKFYLNLLSKFVVLHFIFNMSEILKIFRKLEGIVLKMKKLQTWIDLDFIVYSAWFETKTISGNKLYCCILRT